MKNFIFVFLVIFTTNCVSEEGSTGLLKLAQRNRSLNDPKLEDPEGKKENKQNRVLKKHPINNLTEEGQIASVKENLKNIVYIENPREELLLELVKLDEKAILFIKNPSERILIEAIKKHKEKVIPYIADEDEEGEKVEISSEKVQMALIKENGFFIRYIKNPTERVQLEATKLKPSAIAHITNPTESVQIQVARTERGKYLQYLEHIKNPSEQVQLATLENGTYDNLKPFLERCTPITEKVKFAMARNSYKFTRDMDNPSEELQLATLEKDKYYIRYIDNPSEKLQLKAIENGNVLYFAHIKNPTEKVQLEAVKAQGNVIQYITDPSEEVQLAAIKQSPYNIRYIKNPKDEVRRLGTCLREGLGC